MKVCISFFPAMAERAPLCRFSPLPDYRELAFMAEKPPPSRIFKQVALMAAEERLECSL
jgi:hypothetical protein